MLVLVFHLTQKTSEKLVLSVSPSGDPRNSEVRS